MEELTMKNRVLIAEDEKPISDIIKFNLEKEGYEIITAYDGEDALKKALNEQLELIILDIMLPSMDGFEICKRVREKSSVPIIMVTAKEEEVDKILGLELGADDYITKPFSATYLQARVENLLMQRKKLQSFYRDSLMHINISTGQEEVPVATDMPSAEEDVSETPPTTLEMSPNDRKFMDKLVELMEQNMDNGELVVDDLVRELAVSRSVFFKKLKTLTGLAPIEFIKEMRIKRATQLIETGEFNMTQISYMVGINDPRYFSKCFKAQVGMTPTEYRDRVGR